MNSVNRNINLFDVIFPTIMTFIANFHPNARREKSSLMKTNSLPRALNQSGGAGGGAHGTSPLLQSRSRFSLHKQGSQCDCN